MTSVNTTQAAVAAVLAGVFLGHTAHAARDTDVAAFLHGEVGAGYYGMAERSRLQEYAVEVGKMRQGESGPRFDLRFGVVPGLEVFGSVPYVARGYRSYRNVSRMIQCNYDNEDAPFSGPNCALGSTIHLNTQKNGYEANDVVASPPSYAYGGLDDVLIGMRFAPLHETELGTLNGGRSLGERVFPHLATWRIELGVYVNSGGNFYEQGPGVGATGFLFGTSFSKRIGVSDSYISVTHSRFGTYRASATDAQGGSVDVEIDPPNETDLLFGVELIPYEDPRSGARFAVDFAGGGHVWSTSTVVAGTLLPSVVEMVENPEDGTTSPGTLGTAAVEESRVGFQGRLRLHYQIFRYLRVQLSGNLFYVMPHELESPYNVVQGRVFLVRYGAELSSTF